MDKNSIRLVWSLISASSRAGVSNTKELQYLIRLIAHFAYQSQNVANRQFCSCKQYTYLLLFAEVSVGNLIMLITTVSDEREATQFVLRFDSPFEAPLSDHSSDVFQSWSDSIINPVSISE